MKCIMAFSHGKLLMPTSSPALFEVVVAAVANIILVEETIQLHIHGVKPGLHCAIFLSQEKKSTNMKQVLTIVFTKELSFALNRGCPWVTIS